jgi:hypothetical protein
MLSFAAYSSASSEVSIYPFADTSDVSTKLIIFVYTLSVQRAMG